MEKLTRQITGKPLLPIKILQFGSGNFLRGFADYIIDELNDYGFHAGVAVVKNRPGLSMLDLQQQDGIFTLFTEGVKNGKVTQKSRVITCINTVVNPYNNYEDYLILATEPELKLIVSNTTEAGIYFEPSDSALENTPHHSFAAKLTALLYRRFIWYQGDPEKGLMILPCELVENNGELLRKIVLEYTALWRLEEGFKIWLLQYSKFYNTLVDRIVSGYPKENEAKYTAQLDYTDNLITICEPYLFWAIEGDASLTDHFPFHHFGGDIVLVDDLTPYRVRKIRILNGAHTLMAQIGRLKSLETVGQCMQDAFTHDFILKTITDEILPTMSLPTSLSQQYTVEVLDRFKNPNLRHYLADIAQNTILKFKTRLLPVIVDYIRIHNTYPRHLIFALAVLIHLDKRQSNSEPVSDQVEPKDNCISGKDASRNKYEAIVSHFITQNDFSDRTFNNDNFVLPLSKALELIDTYGLDRGNNKF